MEVVFLFPLNVCYVMNSTNPWIHNQTNYFWDKLRQFSGGLLFLLDIHICNDMRKCSFKKKKKKRKLPTFYIPNTLSADFISKWYSDALLQCNLICGKLKMSMNSYIGKFDVYVWINTKVTMLYCLHLLLWSRIWFKCLFEYVYSAQHQNDWIAHVFIPIGFIFIRWYNAHPYPYVIFQNMFIIYVCI